MSEGFLWLEEIESDEALAWVEERNDEALIRLQGDPRYDGLRRAALDYYTDHGRIPYVTHAKGRVFNFWQDDEHTKGIVRTTTLASYATDDPEWHTLLDIDALAEEEGEDWVYKGRTMLGPACTRWLVHLSKGGGDAAEIREFDVTAGNFVNGGFFLPVAKTFVDWIDIDRLMVTTDFGRGSLTTSGYPRIVKRWHRGTPLEEAEVLFESEREDVMVMPFTICRDEGAFSFISRRPSFFEEETWFLENGNNPRRVPFPADAEFRGVFHDWLIATLRTDWRVEGQTFEAGSLVGITWDDFLAGIDAVEPVLIFKPEPNMAIKEIEASRDAIFVSVMEDVDGALLEIRPGADDDWLIKKVDLPSKGSIDLATVDPIADIVMVGYESYLVPPQLQLINQGADPDVIKSMADRFPATDFETHQYFANSQDGTRIPYYVVCDKDIAYDGNAPAFLHAYGGFEVPVTPAYLTALGIEWLKAGGVIVQANLRGGGEYGPAWHNAALKENRQRAYDDFIAVAEDLIGRKITSPRRLGIRGGSNGGLLVTATMVQRPDLYNAVVCAVPLIDMMRYHKLSAGASWMAEYGDPDVPEEREYILRYSPYQNVKEDAQYPMVFFWTNTKDDRVHPSHARRMVAKMLSQGHEVLYFENTRGGHGGGADPVALAHTTALELVFLMQRLMD